jgi:hypothetical protein
MPCRTDYSEPNARQAESKRVAGHLLYLLPAIGLKPTKAETDAWKTAASEYYGNQSEVDNWTALLCSTIRIMSAAEQDKYIYDGKNANARSLADWWEKHQKWDKKRKAQEQREKRKKKVESLSEQFKKLPIAEQERLLGLAGINTP